MNTSPASGTREEVGTSRWFTLLRGDDGYTLWPPGSVRGEPISRYPDTEEGFEEAWADFEARTRIAHREHLRGRTGGWLARATFATGILWVIAACGDAFVYAYFASGGQARLLLDAGLWLDPITRAGMAMFFTSFIAYLVYWMEARRRQRD